MSLAEAKQMLSDALDSQPGTEKDLLSFAMAGALLRMIDAMSETDARLERIEKDMDRIALKVDQLR